MICPQVGSAQVDMDIDISFEDIASTTSDTTELLLLFVVMSLP